MNKIFRALLVVLISAALLSACSVFPLNTEMPPAMPALQANQGRIYFFRSSSMAPAAFIRPEIRLNGKVVGVSRPGSFFFVDLPAGAYIATASMEPDRPLTLTLRAGEKIYARVAVTFPVPTGRVLIREESPRLAADEVSTLTYSGGADLHAH